MRPITNIFRLRPSETAAGVQAESVLPGRDEKYADETYPDYGKRLCGQTAASCNALSVLIHKIFHDVKKAQLEDLESGKQLAEQTQRQITDNESDIARRMNMLEGCEHSIAQLKQGIVALREAIIGAKPNPEAVIKFRLGFCLILFLSAFLFIFYSSTFFSAFFRDFLATGTDSVSTAMFDPQAFVLSWQAGVTQALFIFLAPIIFMALGFVLHFVVSERGVAKYFKAGVVLMITATFDVILAYKIDRELAYVEFMQTNTDPMATFDLSIRQAFTDTNFWAVIFCGFVVYIIWGLLFDMTYGAYVESSSTVRQVEALQMQIAEKEKEIKEHEAQILKLRNEIVGYEAANRKLRADLDHNALWNPGEVRTCLMQFFAGWMSLMSPLGKTFAEQDSAQATFNHELEILFPQPAAQSTNP